jgi:hypothetical protein
LGATDQRRLQNLLRTRHRDIDTLWGPHFYFVRADSCIIKMLTRARKMGQISKHDFFEHNCEVLSGEVGYRIHPLLVLAVINGARHALGLPLRPYVFDYH